ncbi:response regulator transcription factor [Roseateles amylovorans]|uniref:Response regulator transcription factor n=1 Tax=Roseateles amylovorans TaxID=2978473 RepID=A0ABY6B610_9BURK|nr:response regulator transcription factor [Roseateles amylovorans]UXH80604.1 response regulator transcription factor [Roseateles amylovorans]
MSDPRVFALGGNTGYAMSALAAVPVKRRVLLVDDHELVRAGIRTLYQSLDEISIDWVEASSLQEGLQAYTDCMEGAGVDAVLLDLNLGDCKGLQGLRQFMETFPDARVVVFSGTQDEFVVRQARALGAVGYLPKGALMSEMRSTLRALLGDGQRRAATQGGSLFPRFPSSAMYDRVAELGPRHLEILELVLSGCSNQEISNSTLLSLGTVKNYVSSLLLALDVKSRSHMISLFR